jgi:hypothetical protein
MMTKRIGLEYLEVNQSQKEVTVNEAFNRLDLFVGLTVDNIVSSPPSSASEGTAFLVGNSPTGVFSGKKNYIAHYLNGAYEFYEPFAGMRLYVTSTKTDYRYLEGTWLKVTEPNIQVVDALPTSPASGVIYMVTES